MSLIGMGNVTNLADRLARLYRQIADAAAGANGTVQCAQDIESYVLLLNDYDQEHELLESAHRMISSVATDAIIASVAQGDYSALQAHIAAHGPALHAEIVGIESYCNYFNYLDLVRWQALVPLDFAYYCQACNFGTQFDYKQCFPRITTEATYPGMGSLAFGGAFSGGLSFTRGSTRAKLKVKQTVTGGSTAGFILTGVDSLGTAGKEFRAILDIGLGEGAVNSAVWIIPSDGYSRLTEVTNIEPDPSMLWSTGEVFVVPVQERTY